MISELKIYQEGIIHQFHPKFIGAVSLSGWGLIFLEDLSHGRKTPPWEGDDAFNVVDRLADFHMSSTKEFPSWVPGGEHSDVKDTDFSDLFWVNLGESQSLVDGFCSLFVEPREAGPWIENMLPSFIEYEKKTLEVKGPKSLLHADLRSDNIIFDGDLPVFLDWSNLSIGPSFLDLCCFIPSCSGEGGPKPHKLIKRYEEAIGFSYDIEDLKAGSAFITGFFADRAHLPPIKELPRLRYVQKLQLGAALHWISDVFGCDVPALKPLT